MVYAAKNLPREEEDLAQLAEPEHASSCPPRTLASPGREVARPGAGGKPWATVRTPGLAGRDTIFPSPPAPHTHGSYQTLQATLQITHLAQISPVSAHLTVMLLMFYFPVTPNLRPDCTMFCHLRGKINKEEGRDYCVYKGKLNRTVSVTAFSRPAWQPG